MRKAGSDVHAAWAWIISHTHKDHFVEVSPEILADEIGGTVEAMRAAMDFLLKPDPKSRNPEYEGRRLVEHGPYQYFVPSHDYYNNIANLADLREKNASRQARFRDNHPAKRKAVGRKVSAEIKGEVSANYRHDEADATEAIESGNVDAYTDVTGRAAKRAESREQSQ